MSLTLHLGVVDVPYVDAQGVTTGDVANILEAKYHVVETFYERHQAEVAADLENGLAGALESLMMGAPVSLDPFAAGLQQTEHRFREFLSSREMERLGLPGVPTRAALEGVSHRFKSGKKGKRRPSFIDTGQYQASFAAWVNTGD